MTRSDESILAGDIPGTERFMDLADAALDPILVWNARPIDVGYIDDPGVRAIVALAASCGWNVVHKAGSMVTIVSRSGRKLRLPTNTSIKFSVFTSWVNGVVLHSMTHIPTAELMDKLIQQYKLDASHARVFRQAVSQPAADEEADESDGTDIEVTQEEVTADVAPDEQPTSDPLSVFSERVEPTLSTAAKGQQYVSQIMETVIRKLVPDGVDQITYRCMVCALEFPTKRGVGGHYGYHVTRGEAVAKPEARDNIVHVIPNYVPTEVHVYQPKSEPEPEPPMTDEEWKPFIEAWEVDDEITRLRRIVREVGRIVGREEIAQLQERCQELTIERDEAVTRANRLASDLRSLRELIGGISDE